MRRPKYNSSNVKFIRDDFAQKFAKFRREVGLSQREVAGILNITHTMISQVERGLPVHSVALIIMAYWADIDLRTCVMEEDETQLEML